MRVVTSPDYKTSSSGLLFKDYDEGTGPQPEEGQQVSFEPLVSRHSFLSESNARAAFYL